MQWKFAGKKFYFAVWCSSYTKKMLVLIYHSREFLHTARSLWTRFKSIFECHQYIHVPHLGIWSQIWSINSLNFHLKSFRLIFSPDFNSWKKKKKLWWFHIQFCVIPCKFYFFKKKMPFSHFKNIYYISVKQGYFFYNWWIFWWLWLLFNELFYICRKRNVTKMCTLSSKFFKNSMKIPAWL